MTRRAHLMQVKKTYDKKGIDYTPPDLVAPEFPELLDRQWKVFLRLNSARQAGELGISGLSFTEIKAWCDLMQEQLKPLDVEIIKRLDDIYMRVANG